MPNLQGVSLISFDLWQTVIKSNPDYKLPRNTLIANFLNFQGDLAWLYKGVIEKVNKEADSQTDTDGIPRGLYHRLVKMYQLVSGNDQPPFNEADVKPVSDKLCEIIAEHPPRLIEDDAFETLAALRMRGYKTAIISNTGFAESDHMRIALKVIGLDQYMDHIILSHDEGISKPNPAIFQKLSTISGVSPKRILHIGDNFLADYEGAKNAGLRALMFQNAKNEQECKDHLAISAIRFLPVLLN